METSKATSEKLHNYAESINVKPIKCTYVNLVAYKIKEKLVTILNCANHGKLKTSIGLGTLDREV